MLELGIDYDGMRVHALDLGHALVDRAGRRIIDRDDPVEFDAVAKIEEALGAQQASGRYRIAKRDLFETARALLGFGWRVEIDGKLHRRATSLSLGVATGIDWLDVTVHASFDGWRRWPCRKCWRRSDSSGDRSCCPTDRSPRFQRSGWSGSGAGERARGAYEQHAPVHEGPGGPGDRGARGRGWRAGQDRVALDAAFERRARSCGCSMGSRRSSCQPASFRGTLRDYQKRALGWFAYLQQFGFGGCLADDMGLGKTVQVLALLEARRVELAPKGEGEAADRAPSIVVVPRSLLYNWASGERRALRRSSEVHVHDGGGREATAERFGARST